VSALGSSERISGSCRCGHEPDAPRDYVWRTADDTTSLQKQRAGISLSKKCGPLLVANSRSNQKYPKQFPSGLRTCFGNYIADYVRKANKRTPVPA
jgi:hypothetical protein